MQAFTGMASPVSKLSVPGEPARPATSSLLHTHSGFRSTYVFTTRPNTAAGSTPSIGVADKSLIPHYPSLLKQPFSDALEELCRAFNLKKLSVALRTADAVPPTIEMRLLDCDNDDPSAPIPTHALVVLDTPRTTESKGKQSVVSPLIVPINATIFDQVFNSDLLRYHRTANKPSDSPVSCRKTGVIQLPTIVARVPHPPSLPLLILFVLAPHLRLDNVKQATSQSLVSVSLPLCAPPTPITPNNNPKLPSPPASSVPPLVPLSTCLAVPASASSPPSPSGSPTIPYPLSLTKPLRTDLPTGLLATYLLPISVIEEFPAFAMMSEVFAQTAVSSDEELQAYVVHNQGMWRNLLLLAPLDTRIGEIVRTAWNVTAEARKHRDRMKEVNEFKNDSYAEESDDSD
ncbi:hypothetical protein BC835DRAFT_1319639 [Cytidiella melzeri]|nr:hypothetical protein BC835DRAFT_1319639 [Cytidiella melzeri]